MAISSAPTAGVIRLLLMRRFSSSGSSVCTLRCSSPKPMVWKIFRTNFVILRQCLLDRHSPAARQIEIIFVGPDRVRMTFDHEDLMGMGGEYFLQDGADAVEFSSCSSRTQSSLKPKVTVSISTAGIASRSSGWAATSWKV